MKYQPVRNQEKYKETFSDLDLKYFNIIGTKKHKDSIILLQQAKCGDLFCVKTIYNGHYFLTLEDCQNYMHKRYHLFFDENKLKPMIGGEMDVW